MDYGLAQSTEIKVANFIKTSAILTAILNVVIGALVATEEFWTGFFYVNAALIGCAMLWLFGALVALVAKISNQLEQHRAISSDTANLLRKQRDSTTSVTNDAEQLRAENEELRALLEQVVEQREAAS
jgi:cell shape-determining protein MreC